MKRTATTLAAAAVCAGALLVPAGSAEAAGNTKCFTGGDGRTGTCYTVGPVAKHSVVVEAVPLVNNSSRTVKASCAFTQTITKSIETGISSNTEVKATLFSLVDASTSITIHKKVTQTASQAVTAGGEITLKPHTSITCERTYGYVVSTVTRKVWHDATTTIKKFTVRIPSNLGVTFVD